MPLYMYTTQVLDLPPDIWWDEHVRDAVRRSQSHSRSRSNSPQRGAAPSVPYDQAIAAALSSPNPQQRGVSPVTSTLRV